MDFLCLDFINSQWYNNHQLYQELLRDPGWINDFLTKWKLGNEFNLSEGNINQLCQLRAQLTELIEKISSAKVLSPAELDQINTYLALTKVIPELKYDNIVYTLELTPLVKDFNWLLAQIVVSFTELLTKYDLARIKICQNPACKWVFYDESRNRTRRWCDSSCGSLIKVRRFRARQRNKERRK